MDSNSYVEYLLRNGQALNHQVEELKAIVKRKRDITKEDIIEELTFKKLQEEGVRKKQVSDKTPSIAVVYKEILKKRSMKNLSLMSRVIEATEVELTRLDRAINLLPEENRQILNKLYVRGMTYKEVARDLSISESTLYRHRRKSINKIASYFSMEQILTSSNDKNEYEN